MLMCHIKRECDHPYLKYNKEVVPRQMELLSCYKGLLSAVFKNVVINMFVWFSGCSSIIWITRGRKVRLSFMPPTSCRGSLWTTVKRWDTTYYLQNLPNSWPLIDKLLPVSIHKDSDFILCCSLSESQGVSCQRRPVGRCVNVPRSPVFTVYLCITVGWLELLVTRMQTKTHIFSLIQFIAIVKLFAHVFFVVILFLFDYLLQKRDNSI